MHAYIVPMMLVNRRLRALGQPWLLPELLDMVFARLCKAVTPRWLEVPSPKVHTFFARWWACDPSASSSAAAWNAWPRGCSSHAQWSWPAQAGRPGAERCRA